MSGTEEIRYEVAARVATITLNRPEVLNAFTGEMVLALISRLEEAAGDPGVRVVVLTGAGRGFCAGGDVQSIDGAAERAESEPALDLRTLVRVSELLHTMAKPTLAAVNGACAGAGFSIACATDLRLAAESAVFTTSFIRLGLSGDYGGIWTASKILGSARARELFLLSEKITAATAKEHGLVTRCVPDDAFRAAVDETAARLASFAPLSVAAVKENLNLAETAELADYLDDEVATFTRIIRTKDAGEAVRAFIEKREPEFTGE
jgi:2-(1,2-epoxy-1,2-dihydrophenyl)acetyl-CoA isomerase